MKIYVASSWRNQKQPTVVEVLRQHGHDVYDFRRPPNRSGFAWQEIQATWQGWTCEEFRDRLGDPRAEAGFASDMDALRTCDACLLVLPCGKSAHLELGWAAGAGKQTAILLDRNADGTFEPELMYKMVDQILLRGTNELSRWAGSASANHSAYAWNP